MLTSRPRAHNPPAIDGERRAMRRLPNLWPAAIGASSATYVPFIGRVSVGELLALVLLPVAYKGLQAHTNAARNLLAAVTIAIVWIFVHSTFRGEASTLLVKTVANLFFLCVLAVVAAHFLRRGERQANSFLIYVGLGQILGSFVTPALGSDVNYWKFGFGSGLTIFAVALCERAPSGARRLLVLVVVMMLIVLDLVNDSRSLALFSALSLLAVLPRKRSRPASPASRMGTTLLAAIVGFSIYRGYIWAVTTGRLGLDALERYSWQTGDYGFILGARKDFVFLFANYLQAPFLGSGANATNSALAASQATDWLLANGYSLSFADELRLVQGPELLLHSVMLATLIWAGAFGLPLVMGVAVNLWRAWRYLVLSGSGRASQIFILAAGGWTFLFSPLGDATRLPLALALGMGIVCGSQAHRRLPGVP